jgi:hypothetical protein
MLELVHFTRKFKLWGRWTIANDYSTGDCELKGGTHEIFRYPGDGYLLNNNDNNDAFNSFQCDGIAD